MVFTRLNRKPGNFSYFAQRVENWFVDPAIMALDEYGIPVQVGEKLASILKPEGDLDGVLERLRTLNVNELRLHPFEKTLVQDAQRFA